MHPHFPPPKKLIIFEKPPYEDFPIKKGEVYAAFPEGADLASYPFYYVGDVLKEKNAVLVDDVTIYWNTNRNKVYLRVDNDWKEQKDGLKLVVTEHPDGEIEPIGFICPLNSLELYNSGDNLCLDSSVKNRQTIQKKAKIKVSTEERIRIALGESYRSDYRLKDVL